MRQPGITVGDPDIKTGNNAQLTSDLVFESARCRLDRDGGRHINPIW